MYISEEGETSFATFSQRGHFAEMYVANKMSV